MGLQIDSEDLQRHVVVVELVVAHGHVHVEGKVVSVLQKEALVDVRCLLVVAAQVMHSCERELIFLFVLQLTVVLHQLGLIRSPVSNVEQQPHFQRQIRALEGFLLSLLVQLLEKIARRNVQVYLASDLVRVQQFLISVLCSLEVPQMERAVANPHQEVFRISILAFQAKFKQGQGARVVSIPDELVQRRLSFGPLVFARRGGLLRFHTFHHLAQKLIASREG
mmetsp:Transcript_14919/g.32950  ORF Transcript_14919/g.32950 Transcript_14919/m.32950 type:complete len:223 (+) Transcript_14919:1083-1751(+)